MGHANADVTLAATLPGRRRWFPRAFAIAGWVLLLAWFCFVSIAVAANTSIDLPVAFVAPLAIPAAAVLAAGPIWLIAAGVFAFRAGFKSGARSERIELLLILNLTVGYLVMSLWFR